jgi:plasmid stabilization system protein ParE
MNWTLSIQPRARLEMLEAAGWYAAQSQTAAPNFMRALDATLNRLQENPLQYQRAHGDLRRARVHHFMYSIVYAVVDDRVVILGCVNTHRDPRHWRERKPG